MTIYSSILATCMGDATKNCVLVLQWIMLDKLNFAKQDLLMFEQKSLLHDCLAHLARASKETEEQDRP